MTDTPASLDALEALPTSGLCDNDKAYLIAKARRVEALEAALKKIAQPDYGYMDIIESGQPPEKHADYFCSMVNWRRIVARAALKENTDANVS